MKLVKSLLLGSAAGLCAVAGAQAADLPMRKAAPVEYVRVCTAYGAGFFYIPGTDTCLRVGGRARFEYQYTSNRTANSDVSGFRSTGRLNLDARTQTAYGTLRTFVRIDVASRTGAYLTSGTQQRYANAFPALGQDTFGKAQKFVDVDKAFIQFAGFTAGKAASFFDFYAHDLEYIGSSIGSDVSSTNLLAYTATFGNGFSATLSVEDPVFRRNPTFAPNGFLASVNASATGNSPTQTTNVFLGQVAVSPVATRIDPVTGLPTQAINLNVVQTNYMPDFVGAVRYEAPWGVAQISAAVHELRTGNYTGGVFTTDYGTKSGIAGLPLFTGPVPSAKRPDAEYGYGVQGGLKINLPQIAPGDVLWLQAAYAKGAGAYTGVYVPQGSEVNSNVYTNRSQFAGFDMAVDSFGQTHLTDSWSVTAAFLHYWTPEIRQGVFGSYGETSYDRALRSTQSPATPNGLFYSTLINGVSNAAITAYSPIARDWSNLYVGTNLTWSPVRDLDIGVEAVYERLEFKQGKAVDLNKGVVYSAGPLIGQPTKTISADDNVLVRMRVQRDF